MNTLASVTSGEYLFTTRYGQKWDNADSGTSALTWWKYRLRNWCLMNLAWSNQVSKSAWPSLSVYSVLNCKHFLIIYYAALSCNIIPFIVWGVFHFKATAFVLLHVPAKFYLVPVFLFDVNTRENVSKKVPIRTAR